MTDPTKKIADEDDRTEKLPSPDRGRFGRRVFWTLLVVGLVGAVLIGVSAVNLIPGFKNPFAPQVTDRSQPPILLSIKDLARFVAAEGNFEVVIDLKRDRKFVPDWLLNERTLFVAAGSVEAYVDFSGLTDDKIKDSADHKTVEITLPAPQLAEPKLDLERSYVFAEERGLFNKIGDFFDGDVNRQRETLLVAEQRLAAAAKASTLTQRAQENTRKALEGILHSLGYTSVTIIFQDA
ncbi:MAG TPA: DUF4230 domain-containing protein [Candidatus Limnocylindrales bacterium]